MNMPDEHDRNRRRYGKADDELTGFFSAAIGVRAQNLNSSGGAFNSHEAHWNRLQAMQRGGMAWFDAVAASVAELPLVHRHIVTLVYTPHGAPTWLADALSAPWGGGSFVSMAGRLPRAALAAAERTPGTTVLDWLIWRGRGRKEEALLTSLREDGEALRMPALVAYDALRIARIKAADVAAKDKADRRSERNMVLYSELVGKKRAKERKRRERRTGIAA